MGRLQIRMEVNPDQGNQLAADRTGSRTTEGLQDRQPVRGTRRGTGGHRLYQDIATIPGVSYRWELKHASLDRTHLDGMSVMIGEPGKESAQDATRTTVNGNGDQPGDVGKVISTKVRNKAELGGSSNHSSRNHDGQWETYTGTYIATGTVTRFTFKSVSSSNNVNGNILDDLSFTKAYRLGYDANGGTGQVPRVPRSAGPKPPHPGRMARSGLRPTRARTGVRNHRGRSQGADRHDRQTG